MNYTEKDLKRFWSRVNKSGPVHPVHGTCWNWKTWDGRNFYHYGDFFCQGRIYRAHRFCWELLVGPIPEGLIVCHKCDNGGCVKPSHLFLGTYQDNMTDASVKGRMKSPKAKLNKTQVRRVRQGKESLAKLAREFGITVPALIQVRKRTTYKWVK